MLFILYAALLSSASATPWKRYNSTVIGETVETTSGPVTGHEAPWPAHSGVSEYLGIPYAEPPVGPLRFRAPESYKARGPVNATEFYPGCLQGFNMPDGKTMGGIVSKIDNQVLAYLEGMAGDFTKRSYSEDCLALNVWSKPGSTGKAVMVWIYGGAFLAGDTAGLYYNGARLAAEQDVVVVSVNYRIGAFGFPGSPNIPNQNVGLLDQRKGVEWVRDNIAKFGGDPKRITLFGESAGGGSVEWYSLAWTQDPIVNAFISQSGAAFMGEFPVAGTNFTSWFTLSEKVGCPGRKDEAKNQDCMQQVPATKILDNPGLFLPFPDEKTIFSNNAKRLAEGRFIQRPLLIGSLDAETSLFPALIFSIMRNVGDAFGLVPSLLFRLPLALIDVFRTLPSASGFDILGCSPKSKAAAWTRYAPVWRYRMWGDWPNLHIYYNTKSYHSMDVPIVFGATERISKIPDTPDEAELVKKTMTAWATFAKDPDRGLSTLGWPRYNPGTKSLVRIGYQNSPSISLAESSQYDASCGA